MKNQQALSSRRCHALNYSVAGIPSDRTSAAAARDSPAFTGRTDTSELRLRELLVAPSDSTRIALSSSLPLSALPSLDDTNSECGGDNAIASRQAIIARALDEALRITSVYSTTEGYSKEARMTSIPSPAPPRGTSRRCPKE